MKNQEQDLSLATTQKMDFAQPEQGKQLSESERMFSMIESMATDPRVDPAKLREILSVKQSWEADEARKAFAKDMATFQSECPIISKADSANGKMYAKIDRIHRETRELRKKCGFWFTWSVCEISGDIARMEGFLGHSGGHTIPIKQVIPLPEEIVSGSGKLAQNSSQRAGSAMTYAKRYGECLALDIVTGEDFDANVKKTRPDGPASSSNPLTEAREKLWRLLKPIVSQDSNWNPKTWDGHQKWLWDREIMDVAAVERLPNISLAHFEKVIAATEKELSHV
ncbi:MAG: ERF family protein [Patescibacteria group bacterium]|nr:ERF family protein [Patescibacteria group bacterium]